MFASVWYQSESGPQALNQFELRQAATGFRRMPSDSRRFMMTQENARRHVIAIYEAPPLPGPNPGRKGLSQQLGLCLAHKKALTSKCCPI